MFKKFLVGFLLIIQNFAVASEPCSYEKFYTHADQASFEMMQDIHAVAIKAAGALGYDNIGFVANVDFLEIKKADKERFEQEGLKLEYVEKAGKLYWKRYGEYIFHDLAAHQPLSRGFMLLKSQAHSACPFDLISPFGHSQLAYVFNQSWYVHKPGLIDIDKEKAHEFNMQFFEQLKEQGLELKFRQMFNDEDDYRTEKDVSAEAINGKTGKKVLTSAHKGSSEYLISNNEKGSQGYRFTSFYEITAVNGRPLPTVEYHPLDSLPPLEMGDIKTIEEANKSEEYSKFLKYGIKKYHDYVRLNDSKRGFAAGGAGSEELK